MTPDDLKKLRSEAGLTQGQLADQLGMSLRAFQDLEAGKAAVREVHRLALVGLGLIPAADDREALAGQAARMVARYDRSIEVARATLKRIDRGMKFFEAQGSEPMREVTAQRRAETVDAIAAAQDARRLWQAVAPVELADED